MVCYENGSSRSRLTFIIQDTPPDAAENPGIEGKRPDDPYAGSPNEEYSDGYDDGWFVGKAQHKGRNSHAKDREEEDAIEVGPRFYKASHDRRLTWGFLSPVGERQEKPRGSGHRFWSRRLL